MNFLYPRIQSRQWKPMLLVAFVGMLLGRVYGILHDLVTFSISPEYFTKQKFDQFSWADLGLDDRLFAAEVGMIATGGVGLIAGWFLARVIIPHRPLPGAWPFIGGCFSITLGLAMMLGLAALLISAKYPGDTAFMHQLCASMNVRDVKAFSRVSSIHAASYLGGLLGLIVALLLAHRACRQHLQESAHNAPS